MIFFIFIVLLTKSINLVESASTRESSTLSDTLKWEYVAVNLNCTDARGGRNPCRDVRTCNFAVASLMLGGWPTICGWVGKGVPKVCCGLPLVLGGELISKVNAEKSRKRECGRRTMSTGLSETENKFFQTVKTLLPIDTSHPEQYDPPLDLTVESMVLPVGGGPSRQGDFPWMVAIYRGSTFLCGGSLIDRVHVLSAAHCFATGKSGLIDPAPYLVRIGNINVDKGYPFAVSRIKVHEGYIPKQYYNDIAILTLASEILVPIIAHICLPDIKLANIDLTGKNTTLLDFGDTEFDGRNAPSLLIVDDIPVVSNSECRAAYSNMEKSHLPDGITENFICAGRSDGGKDACQQDFGAPLMYKNNYQNLHDFHPDIPWVLVGIASFGFGCSEPGYPGVYTRVSNYMDWIKENTGSPFMTMKATF